MWSDFLTASPGFVKGGLRDEEIDHFPFARRMWTANFDGVSLRNRTELDTPRWVRSSCPTARELFRDKFGGVAKAAGRDKPAGRRPADARRQLGNASGQHREDHGAALSVRGPTRETVDAHFEPIFYLAEWAINRGR